MTLPGFLHDSCSAIHPLAAASPFFRSLPMADYGVDLIQPPLALAHPFDDGSAAILNQSIPETAASLGEDAEAWEKLFTPLVEDFEILSSQLLGPFRLPRHPISLARFGIHALLPAHWMAKRTFSGAKGRALFTGLSAHSILDLSKPASAAFGLVLGMFGHAVGWPLPRGGSQKISDALAQQLRELGGTIQTGSRVTSLDFAREARAVLFDTSPRQFIEIAGSDVPDRYRRQLGRYRYGASVFKIDWALDGPAPWNAEECRQAGTVHIGGTMEEIVHAEHEVARGRHPERPLVLAAQHSLFDPTRSPDGKHTLWGYCHVPNGSTQDMTQQIEAQVERFAPGFGELILKRTVTNSIALETSNANYIGGDINAGMQDLRQLFTRPAPRFDPYTTPNPRLFFCSASTPPGGGVHGMGGYHAAKSAMRRALT
jgi:phytoene dehydrogenase-like protein